MFIVCINGTSVLKIIPLNSITYWFKWDSTRIMSSSELVICRVFGNMYAISLVLLVFSILNIHINMIFQVKERVRRYGAMHPIITHVITFSE